jgi:hypothetical protein
MTAVRGKLLQRRTLRVDSLRVGAGLLEGCFVLKFPKGAAVMDERSGEATTAP